MSMTDYSNTIIYKISCKDPTVSGIYVGHTTDFTKRKYSHMNSSLDTNNTVLLYRTIRFYGGWDNWEMKIVGFFDCKNLTEAREKEQEFYLSLHANLNSVEPMPTRAAVSVIATVEIPVLNATESNNVDKPNKIKHICQECNFVGSDKTKLTRHLSTLRCKINHNLIAKPVKSIKQHVCGCGKIYKYHQGLSVHKKNCNGVASNDNALQIEKLTNRIDKLITEQHEMRVALQHFAIRTP